MTNTNETYDFKDGYGPVPAHKHPNGGGWIAKTATVEHGCYVEPNARVYGNARVSGNARVYGTAVVFGNARVYGNARVSGNARVYGTAVVFGNARVSGNAVVYGNAVVFGNAVVKRGLYKSTPTSITRSDGYTFTIQTDNSVVAGCRDFTKEEAKEHWGNPVHHKHKESYAILAALYSISKAVE